LLGDAGYATCPLPAITDYTDVLKVMRASKIQNERAPGRKGRVDGIREKGSFQ